MKSCVVEDQIVEWVGRWELEMRRMMKLAKKLECWTEPDKQTGR